MRDQFALLRENKNLTFLDAANFTPLPDKVVDSINGSFTSSPATGYRSSYTLARHTTKRLEKVRQQISELIGAEDPEEISFLPNSTYALNTLVLGLKHTVQKHDNVLYPEADHISVLAPFHKLKEELNYTGTNIDLVSYGLSLSGHANFTDLKKKLNWNTRFIILNHIHGVFGAQSHVEKHIKEFPDKPVKILDMTHSIGRIPINVSELGVDAAYFSAQKVFGLSGLSVLWTTKKIKDQVINPFAGSIGEREHSLELGSLNVAAINSLGSAIEFISDIGIKNISTHNLELTRYLIDCLKEVPNIAFNKGPAICNCSMGYGIQSFTLNNINTGELGFLLDQAKIALRIGSSCTNGAANTDNIRVSTHIYNNKQDIDRLTDALLQLTL